nr:hypothetical protein Itr_chr12CG17880 [Ipomoea trifida]
MREVPELLWLPVELPSEREEGRRWKLRSSSLRRTRDPIDGQALSPKQKGSRRLHRCYGQRKLEVPGCPYCCCWVNQGHWNWSSRRSSLKLESQSCLLSPTTPVVAGGFAGQLLYYHRRERGRKRGEATTASDLLLHYRPRERG